VAEAVEQKRWKRRDASEAAAYIGGIGMHGKSTEADGDDGADGAGSKYKVSEVVKTVRTYQNSLGQNGTRLGLLLLHIGPTGDRYRGQAFMEHYTAIHLISPTGLSHRRWLSAIPLHCKGTSICFLTSPLLSYSPPVHMSGLFSASLSVGSASAAAAAQWVWFPLPISSMEAEGAPSPSWRAW
jgi:hypothetical protein